MKKSLILLFFMVFSSHLYAMRFLQNDIISVEGGYFKAMQELDTIAANGYGGHITYTFRDLLFMNFDLGIKTGYARFAGKDNFLDVMHHIPALIDLSYRIPIIGAFSCAPQIAAGGSYNVLIYQESNNDSSTQHAAFEPTASAGLMFYLNLSSSLVLQTGVHYNVIFEKDATNYFLTATAGIGYRFGQGHYSEKLNQQSHMSVSNNKSSSIQITLEKIPFGKAPYLSKEHNKELDYLAEMLKNSKIKRIELLGHWNKIGKHGTRSELYLSQAAAATVYNYLIARHRINRYLFKIIPKGAKEPITGNVSKSGQEKNRRVAIIVYKK